jgi:hypothetical protein
MEPIISAVLRSVVAFSDPLPFSPPKGESLNLTPLRNKEGMGEVFRSGVVLSERDRFS